MLTKRRPTSVSVLLTVAVASFFHITGGIEIEISPAYPSQCMRPARRFLSSDSGESDIKLGNVSPLRPEDILPRLKAAATLRDNIVTALGNILLLCLTEDARVPIEVIHDAVKTRNVPTYELLPLLPIMRNKIPRQQLYSVLQMFEKIGSRFVSEYATLCMEALSDGSIPMEKVTTVNILTGIDNSTVESIVKDKRRKLEPPLTQHEALSFVMDAVNNEALNLNLKVIGSLLMNLPNFDFTDPEVPDSLRFVAAKMEEMSDKTNDTLLEYLAPYQLGSADKLVKAILDRLEITELPLETFREAISILIQNFDVPSYPSEPSWKNNLKNLFSITTDYYSGEAVAIASLLYNELNETDLSELDIGFLEEGTEALLQVLTRLREKPGLSHLEKPISMLIPFVSQKIWHETTSDISVPITFSEVKDYLDSLSMPCLPKEVIHAGDQLRPLLSENLPWTYAFGHRGVSGNPWTMIMSALVKLRGTPLSEKRALLMDNFIYQVQSRNLDKQRSALYDFGIIFQREDSREVELDIYSLLMRIPNAFKEERFSPMLNFFSRPNLFRLLGHEFNKFEYDKPRNLLLGLLNKVISIPAVQSDSSLALALKGARDYLEEPLLVNMYTSNDLQALIRLLPQIDEDPRYLPLKILFKKQKLFAYISPTFSLAGINSPMKHLELILNTLNMKPTHKQLSESIKFALYSIESQPIPPRIFNYEDFTYLVNQLLSQQKSIKNTIINYDGFKEIEFWQMSVRGTPEAILLRAITDLPLNKSSSNQQLLQDLQMAEKILADEVLIDIPILKKNTLESMLEYLPDTAYVKPVNLLLKKANLIMLVPKINLTLLEGTGPRESLITLIKALIESRNVRAEKTLLRRLRSTLRDIDAGDESTRHNLLVSYLMQVLKNPSTTIFKPLITELQTANVNVTLENRDKTLKAYLNRLRKSSRNTQLKKAAQKALEEMYEYASFHPTQEIDNKKVEDALLLLSRDSSVDPLKKLLTLSWLRTILPSTFKTSDYQDQQQLLRVILFYTKQRPEVADNPSLMKGIMEVEKGLGGWATDVESLRKLVANVKSTIYDPIRNLLSATNLNKLNIILDNSDVSAKIQLLGVLHQLFGHTTIKTNEKIMKVLAAVLEDINNFAVNKDLLTILDDVGIPHTPKLAPLRIFLHKEEMGEKYNQVFRYQDRHERFNALLHLLRKDKEVKSQTKLMTAISILKTSSVSKVEFEPTVSDLLDIIHAIPNNIVIQHSDVAELFNINVLSYISDRTDIIRSINPISALLLKISELPIVTKNYTLLNRVMRMYKEVQHLPKQQIITGFLLKPLLRELNHVESINVDYVNQVIDPEFLRYLDSPDYSDMIDDNVEILRYIVNYVLSHGVVETDKTLQIHLNSFNRDLQLAMGPSKLSKYGLTGKELNKLLLLIPKGKVYSAIKIFLQSKEIFRYIRSVDFKKFSKMHEKLIKVLKVLDTSDLTNKKLRESLKMLLQHLRARYNFISKGQVHKMFRALAELKLKVDVAALKIFLNHDNLIKYLPRTFRYQTYKTPKEALLAVLEIFIRVPALQKRTKLTEAMVIAKAALQTAPTTQPIDKSYRKALTHETLTIKDLEFVKVINVTSPKLKTFFEPQKLLEILPETFSFEDQPTFKLKTMHLIRQLLMLDTEMHNELKIVLHDIQTKPDVPKITKSDLRFILDIIPDKGIPYLAQLKKFLTVSKLTALLPATFVVKENIKPKEMLHKLLFTLNFVMGKGKDQKVQVAIDSLLSEVLKGYSPLIPDNSTLSINDIQNLISEIPFKQYQDLKPLETILEPSRIVAALPLNFNLTEYETKKLRVLAMLGQVSHSKEFETWLKSIRFAEKIIGEMPDAPRVNDADIVRLLDSVPLDAFYLTRLKESCTIRILSPYLPINFNMNTLETRRQKFLEIMKYCEMSNPVDYSTRQALDNLKTMLKNSPGLDIRHDQITSMVDEVPCTSFSATKPLKMYLLKNDITASIPWDLDIESQDLYKTRLSSLVKGLRNVKELQNKQMFVALDALLLDIKGMPDKPNYQEEIINKIKSDYPMDQPEAKACANGFTLRDSWKFMPSSINMFAADTKIYLLLFLIYSEKFPKLRDNKEFMESCNFVKIKLLEEAKMKTLKKLQGSSSFISYVPLYLHVRGWGDHFFDAIHYNEWTCRHPWKCFYGYERDMLSQNIRIPLKVLQSTPLVAKSKALNDAIDAVQHIMLSPPIGYYEIEEAINEIPRSEKYDELRLLLGCNDIIYRYKSEFSNYTKDTTAKSILLNMLYMIKSSDGDSQTLNLVNTLREDVARAVRDWEVEQMFRTLSDYTFHIPKLEPIRSYYILHGPDEILGIDYMQKYSDNQKKLAAVYRAMMALSASKLGGELRESLEYLQKVMNNQIRISRQVIRSVRDINVKALFVALPKTRDERIIAGALRFFSNSNLLTSLDLRKSPFEYETKGNLLQAILDKGLELQSVQKDSLQQDALEFFRDKVLMTGPGAEPIELRNSAENSNRNVDLLDLLKAIDITSKERLNAAGELTVFLERDYNNHIYGVGFDQAAYTSCGSYLKAFLQHLVKVPELPRSVKDQIDTLIPAVKLNNSGADPINMYDDNKPDNRMFADEIFPDLTPESRILYANESLIEKMSMIRPSGTSKSLQSPSYRMFPPVFGTLLTGGSLSYKQLESTQAELQNAISNMLEHTSASGGGSVDFKFDGEKLDVGAQFKEAMSFGLRSMKLNNNSVKTKSGTNRVSRKNLGVTPKSHSMSRRSSINNSIERDKQINSLRYYEDAITPQKGVEQSSQGGSMKPISARKKLSGRTKRTQGHVHSERFVDSATFHPGKILFNHKQRLTNADAESATFHPHKILVQPHTRRSGNGIVPQITMNNTTYVTMEEAENMVNKKRQPVQPIDTESLKLPEPDTTEKFLEHSPERKNLPLNLKSRKLFIRPDTSVDIDYSEYSSSTDHEVPAQRNMDAFEKTIPRDNSNDNTRRALKMIPLDYYSSEERTSRTVKKDLSKDLLSEGTSLTVSDYNLYDDSTYHDISEKRSDKLTDQYNELYPVRGKVTPRHKKHEDLPSIELKVEENRGSLFDPENSESISLSKVKLKFTKERDILSETDLKFLSNKNHINRTKRKRRITKSKSKHKKHSSDLRLASEKGKKKENTDQRTFKPNLFNLDFYENPFHADIPKMEQSLVISPHKKRKKSAQ